MRSVLFAQTEVLNIAEIWSIVYPSMKAKAFHAGMSSISFLTFPE